MSPLTVSVVIPSYNQGGYLREAVESVHAAAAGRDVEVVVVDDGSTDDSPEVLRRMGSAVTPILLDRNGGGGAALNAGIAAAGGDVLCLLDADDRFTAGKLDEVERAYAQVPDAGWVFHRRSLIDATGAPGGEPDDDADLPYGSRWDVRPLLQAGRLPYLPTSTSCLTAPAAVLRGIGPLPEHPGALNDNFVKTMLCLQAPGVFLEGRLSEVRLHEDNSYSGRGRTWSQDAAMHLPTAADLVERDPRAGLTAEGMVAGIVGRTDGRWRQDAGARHHLHRYLAAADPVSAGRIRGLRRRMAAKNAVAGLRSRLPGG